MVTAIAILYAKTVWHDAPFLQYEQIRLNGNLRQYLETSLIVHKVFRMEIQKTSFQKSYELTIGAQSYTVEYNAENRQFNWNHYF